MNSLFSNISSTSFVSSAFIIGMLLRNELTMNEQNAISEWLTLIATTLQSNAAWLQVQSDQAETNKTPDDKDTSMDITLLKNVLNKMQKEIDNLKNK